MKSVFAGVLLVFMLGLAACIPFGAVDGSADGKVLVWFDKNANGIADPGEKPIPRVLVGIGYPDTYTDENGKASVGRFKPGCAGFCWQGETIQVRAPKGYKATTPTEVPLTGEDQTYQFGFTLDPTSATPTSYLAHLACKTYAGVAAEDAVVTPDGLLWFALSNGAAKYDPQSDQFRLYDGLPGLYADIHAGENNEIWITSQEYNISRYLDGEWLTYGKDSLITASDLGFGLPASDLIWFARQAPPNSIISFNKKTGAWQYFTQPDNLDYVIGQKVRVSTDGSTWFAAFDYRSQMKVPPPDAKIQWRVDDVHTFTRGEIFQTPDLGWIEDSQVTADGTIWLVTTEGLAHFNPTINDWKVHPWPRSDGMSPSIDTSSLAIGPDGSIWIGTSSNQKPLALRYIPDAKDGTWYNYDERDGIPEIDNLAITPDERIWFGSGLSSDGVVGCSLLK